VRGGAALFIVILIALVAWWCIGGHATPGTIVLACVATSPLWLGLPRILAGHRRTYAWMTLALAPYLVLAITEAIANPARRTLAGVCLFVTLLLFALLVAHLRVTRNVTDAPSLP
jgi:uncharacterized membrane protein